jgi:lysozyme
MKIFFAANVCLFFCEALLFEAVREKRSALPALIQPSNAPLHCPPSLPSVLIPILPSEAPAPKVSEKEADALLFRLIKEKEGFRSKPYFCPAGVKTIGYGFTAAKYVNRKSMTEAEASRILEKELIPAAKKTVSKLVKVPLSPLQKAALVSFVFNCGERNLSRLVNGENRLNSGNYERTASLLLLYTKANGKTLKGLVKRREMEAKMFLESV